MGPMARRPAVRLLCGGGLVVLGLAPSRAFGVALAALPAAAQQLQVWPGFRDTNGPSIEIETEDNGRCRYSEDARPSFSGAGLGTNPSSSVAVTVGNGNSAIASQLSGGLTHDFLRGKRCGLLPPPGGPAGAPHQARPWGRAAGAGADHPGAIPAARRLDRSGSRHSRRQPRLLGPAHQAGI